VVLAPVVTGGVLGAVGFGAGGVVAGSAAAGIQAGMGNIAGGSLFALAQSIGAGASLPPVLSAVGGVIGASVGSASSKLSIFFP